MPPAVLVAALAFIVLQSPQAFALRLLVPSFALGILVVLGLHAAWRVWAILDSWGSSRGNRLFRDLSAPVALALCLAVVLAHGVAAFYVESVTTAGRQIFQDGAGIAQPSPGNLDEWMGSAPSPTPNPPSAGGPTQPPSPDETGPSPTTTPAPTVLPGGAINILFVGVDSGFGRDHALTDSIFLTSYDPSQQRLIQISIPRDTGMFPLFSGGTYLPRINTFMRFARNNPDRFPGSPLGTLAHEVGYLLGVDIPYYAIVNMEGFVALIDLVGGVDVTVDKPIADPRWNLQLAVGDHHLDGATALIYVRSRYGPGNNDYERARRQQQIILAVAKKVHDPFVMTRLPEIAAKVAELVRTNVPIDQLDKLIEITDRATSAEVEKYVLSPPEYSQRIPAFLVGGRWMTQLNMDAVAQLSIELFGEQSRYGQTAQP